MSLETNPITSDALPPVPSRWTAPVPTFAAASVIIVMATVMVAISAVYGLLPQV